MNQMHSTFLDCPEGFWGSDCLQPCGHCDISPSCDKDTGECLYGCQNGWQLPLCNLCVDGVYGPTCQQLCGHCLHEAPCDKTEGLCLSGCDPGWMGNGCDDGRSHFLIAFLLFWFG